MTNDKLTPERIEAAIPEVTRIRDAIYHRRSSIHLDTALAALDLAERLRWRPVTSNDPEVAETVLLKPNEQETSIKLPFIGFRTEREQRTVFYSLSGDEWYESELLGYMPLPEWEG